MATNTTRADDEAAAWEADPSCAASCELACKAILQNIPQLQGGKTKPDVLECGSGSGMLSLMLAPHVRTLTGTDVSHAMIAAFSAKAAQQGASHLAAVQYDAHNPDFTVAPAATRRLIEQAGGTVDEGQVRWDMLVSNMLTHHFANMDEWMKIAYFCLAPGGRLVMVDFLHTGPESALFHPPAMRDKVAMHGISRDAFKKQMSDAGFIDVSVEPLDSLTKAVDPAEAAGKTALEFPMAVFLGTKPAR